MKLTEHLDGIQKELWRIVYEERNLHNWEEPHICSDKCYQRELNIKRLRKSFTNLKRYLKNIENPDTTVTK